MRRFAKPPRIVSLRPRQLYLAASAGFSVGVIPSSPAHTGPSRQFGGNLLATRPECFTCNNSCTGLGKIGPRQNRGDVP